MKGDIVEGRGGEEIESSMREGQRELECIYHHFLFIHLLKNAPVFSVSGIDS